MEIASGGWLSAVVVKFSEKMFCISLVAKVQVQFDDKFVAGIHLEPTKRTDEIIVGTYRGLLREKFQEAAERAAR